MQINKSAPTYWDWQVTVCFYVGVHVVNAHIAKVGNLHYHTHEAVKNVLNPFNTLSICKLPEPIYLDYEKLEGLSRRSRYLCNETAPSQSVEKSHATYDKHFAKSIKCLDRVLVHFNGLYSIGFGGYEISCVELKKTPLSLFKIK